MPNDPRNYCRVCGLDQGEFIWGEDGRSPTYGICACCGVEFGYGDGDVENCVAIRHHWINIEGARWRESKEKPKGWILENQIKQIPIGFRDEDVMMS